MKFTIEQGRDFFGLFISYTTEYYHLKVEPEKVTATVETELLCWRKHLPIQGEGAGEFYLSERVLKKLFDALHRYSLRPLEFVIEDEQLQVFHQKKEVVALSLELEYKPLKRWQEDNVIPYHEDLFSPLARIKVVDWQQLIVDNLLLFDFIPQVVPRVDVNDRATITLEFGVERLLYEGINSTKTLWGQIPLEPSDNIYLSQGAKLRLPLLAIALTDLLIEGEEYVRIDDDGCNVKIATSQGEIVVEGQEALFRVGAVERNSEATWSQELIDEDLVHFRDLLAERQELIKQDFAGQFVGFKDFLSCCFPDEEWYCKIYSDRRLNVELLANAVDAITGDELKVIVGQEIHYSCNDYREFNCFYVGNHRHGIQLLMGRIVDNLYRTGHEFPKPDLNKSGEQIAIDKNYLPYLLPCYSLAEKRQYIQRQLSTQFPSLVDELKAYDKWSNVALEIEGYEENDPNLEFLFRFPIGDERASDYATFGLLGDPELLWLGPLGEEPLRLRREPSLLYFANIGSLFSDNLIQTLTAVSLIKEYSRDECWEVQMTYN